MVADKNTNDELVRQVDFSYDTLDRRVAKQISHYAPPSTTPTSVETLGYVNEGSSVVFEIDLNDNGYRFLDNNPNRQRVVGETGLSDAELDAIYGSSVSRFIGETTRSIFGDERLAAEYVQNGVTKTKLFKSVNTHFILKM